MKKILLLLILLLGMCTQQDLKYDIVFFEEKQTERYYTESLKNMLKKGYVSQGKMFTDVQIYKKIPNLENDVIITNKGVYIPHSSIDDFLEYIMLAKNITMNAYFNGMVESIDEEYIEYYVPLDREITYIKKTSPAWYETLKWGAYVHFTEDDTQIFSDITFEYIPKNQIFPYKITEQTKNEFIKALINYEIENNVEFASLHVEENDTHLYFMKYI